ncbi:hypothetical protein Pmar_PMAR014678 [Perkinsus marinus ATCC 50983]|uniref:CDT1 Geminin-binding domain-containing protein n=1 Tax=Perkinsus marinus (strain ATCC 50983 / TXsc) TaxID=423536 RepID=C5LIQ6_PERM5|nr:hypothetical protein Pmar_PMAR014678 [Perkinsus marinus ATCC 50983]EER03459.1 hypothetical protein Pmar_PMAR014678 [Perkinsus marinus ATCC 50983]|eukprot:XP_002771643.1 hypothetical protein Pmar_PMAR014678 [Perkinsus marinus ATCC 50983]
MSSTVTATDLDERPHFGGIALSDQDYGCIGDRIPNLWYPESLQLALLGVDESSGMELDLGPSLPRDLTTPELSQSTTVEQGDPLSPETCSVSGTPTRVDSRLPALAPIEERAGIEPQRTGRIGPRMSMGNDTTMDDTRSISSVDSRREKRTSPLSRFPGQQTFEDIRPKEPSLAFVIPAPRGPCRVVNNFFISYAGQGCFPTNQVEASVSSPCEPACCPLQPTLPQQYQMAGPGNVKMCPSHGQCGSTSQDFTRNASNIVTNNFYLTLARHAGRAPTGPMSMATSRSTSQKRKRESTSPDSDPLCATPRKNLFGCPVDEGLGLPPTTPKSSRPSAKRHNSGTPKRPGESSREEFQIFTVGSRRDSLLRGRPSTRGRASIATNRSSCGTRMSMGEVVDQLELPSTGGKGRDSLPRDTRGDRGPVKNLFKEFTEEKQDDPKAAKLPTPPVATVGATTKLPIPEELKKAQPSVSAGKRSLPSHYKTVLDQFRMLDEVLSLFRVRSQVPYYLQLKAGVERASGKRFAKGRLLQVVFAAGGLLELEWREKECEVDSMGTSPLRRLVVIQRDATGAILTKRLDAKEALARADVVRAQLEKLLAEQERSCSDPKKFLTDEADPVPQAVLPSNPYEASPTVNSTPVLRGRGTPSPDVTPQTPCSLMLSGVRARRRERLELSSSPFVPVILPQLSEPMTPARTPSVRNNIRSRSASKTPAERRQEMRERVRAKEAKEKEDAQIYEEDLKWREQLSFFELLSSIVSELSRLFFMREHPSMKLQDVVKHFMSANGGGRRYKALGTRVMEDYLRQTADLAPEWIKIVHSTIDNRTEMLKMNMSAKSKAVLSKIKDKKEALTAEYTEWQSKLPTSPRLIPSTGG